MSNPSDNANVGTEANPIVTTETNAAPSLIDQMAGGLQQAMGNITGNRVAQEEGAIRKTEGANAAGGLSENIAAEANATKDASSTTNA